MKITVYVEVADRVPASEMPNLAWSIHNLIVFHHGEIIERMGVTYDRPTEA